MNKHLLPVKASLAVFLFLLPVLSGWADEYWMKGMAGGVVGGVGTSPLSGNYWTNSVGMEATAIAATDTLYAPKGTFSATLSFTHNGPFHAGAADGSSTLGFNVRQNTSTLNDLRWHSAELVHNYGGRLGWLKGSATLDQPQATHRIGEFSNSDKSGIVLACALISADETMAVTVQSRERPGGLVVIAGDNVNYNGNFINETALTPLVAANANALGNPVRARSDALVIRKANAVFSVAGGVLLNAARGLTIEADSFHVRAREYVTYNGHYSDCAAFELAMPITGSKGFIKDGTGTVTLSGPYTAGDIAVSEGTLHIAATASFPAGQKISVADGASLFVHQALSGFEIAAEEGARVERVIDPLTVAYDPDGLTAAPVVRNGAFRIPEGMTQPIGLSSAIALPLHDGLTVEVLTVAAGAADLSVEDFTDSTPKTHGLPKTSFTVEKDGAGVQHVYLTARPVVVSTRSFSNDDSINGVAANWSNGKVAQRGFDYLVQHSVGNVRNDVFAGDSLAIAPGVELRLREIRHRLETAGGESVVVWPGVYTTQSFSGRNMTLAGALHLPGDYGDASAFTFHLKYGKTEANDGTLSLTATLSGAGTLRVRGAKNGTSWNGLAGDFTGWYGRLIMTGNGTTDEYKGVQVRVSTDRSFGGRLPEFKEDAVTLTDYAMIKAVADVSLADDRNRGLYVAGKGGFTVDPGKTFAYSWPLKVDGALYKHGEGLLKMGGAVSFGTGGKAFFVRAGAVAPLSDAAVAGLDVVFSNGTEIVVPPGALEVGFTGTLSVLPDPATGQAGRVRVTVSPAFDTGSSAAFEAVLCTVAESAGDVSALFDIVAPDGFEASLVQTAVTVGETAAVRCSVRYRRRGLSVIVR